MFGAHALKDGTEGRQPYDTGMRIAGQAIKFRTDLIGPSDHFLPAHATEMAIKNLRVFAQEQFVQG